MIFGKAYLLLTLFFLTMPSAVLADEKQDLVQKAVVEKRVVDIDAAEKAVGKITFSSPSYGPGLQKWFKYNTRTANGKLLRRSDLPRVKLYRSKKGEAVYDLYENNGNNVNLD